MTLADTEMKREKNTNEYVEKVESKRANNKSESKPNSSDERRTTAGEDTNIFSYSTSSRRVGLYQMALKHVFVLVPLHVEPPVRSILFSSVFLTLSALLSDGGFINRPLYFLSKPQRA